MKRAAQPIIVGESVKDPLRTLGASAIVTQMRTISEIIEAATSADGTKRWELIRRADGFFVYSEDTFVSEDLREFGAGIEEYWSPTHISGLFDTSEAAKLDAIGQLGWLKEVGSAQ